MNGEIMSVFLTERPEDGIVDYDNINTDVIVEFENGDRYSAIFYSHKNLHEVMTETERSEEYRSYTYYKVLDIVLVRDFNGGDLRPVIEAMLKEGDFQLVFKKI
jgi:hypothetical protein